MEIKAIYSFKQFKNHYKPLNKEFYKLAKYSVDQASKFYRTKLYCDKKSKNIFTKYDILFDEYEVLDSIESYKGRSYCMPKVYAMIAETSPYVHLDFDAIVYEELVFDKSITYGNLEVDLTYRANTDAINYLQSHYIKDYEEYLGTIFEDTIEVDWRKVPNHSLIAVKNPELLKEIYTEILDKVPYDVIEKVTPMLIEQYLPYRYFIKNKVQIGFIDKHVIPEIGTKLNGSFRFFHYQNYNSNTFEMEQLFNRIDKIYSKSQIIL